MSELPSKAEVDPRSCDVANAKTGCEQSQQNLRLFDHLVGEREQVTGDCDA
jgi:hypothetical protein